MNIIRTACVYCGSSQDSASIYQENAYTLGEQLALNHIQLVFGGSHAGLMGRVATGALSAQGHVTGYIPQYLLHLEGEYAGITELFVVDSMQTRKQKMFEKSDAFIILPGGFGTLDELTEILVLKQIGLHHKPIIFLNLQSYWTPFLHLIDHIITEGFAHLNHKALFKVEDTVEGAVKYLKNYDPTEYVPVKKFG